MPGGEGATTSSRRRRTPAPSCSSRACSSAWPASCRKTCNDLRLLSTGPQAGFGDIKLPPRQAGSSIMPGKVNPVIPEVMNQVAFEVIGNDVTITMAAEAGQLQLNAFEPIMGWSLYKSVRHLRQACLTLQAATASTASRPTASCWRAASRESVTLVTALNPLIGYEKAALIAKTALATGAHDRRHAHALGVMSVAEMQALLVPERLTQPVRLGARTARRMSTARHRVVIVGGGAGGLELATRLGDRLGRARRRHADRPPSRPRLEAQAARDRRGSMDMAAHEVDYLAQAHWHGFRYRIGEMTGLDRAAPRGACRRFARRGRPRGHAAARFRLRHAGDRGRQPEQRLRHAGRARARDEAGDARRRAALPRLHGQRLHAGACADDAIASGATEGRDHRRRRHRGRARRGAAPHDARDGGLRPRRRRRRQGPSGQRDRGRRARCCPRCRARLSHATEAALRKLGVRVHTSARVAEVLPTACAWPTAACCRPSWWCGRRASRPRTS